MSAGHDHSHTPANFNGAFAIGIGPNLAFVAMAALYGFKLNSLADRLQPGARHTCGWKRARILAAFANALLLLMATGTSQVALTARLVIPQAHAAHPGTHA